MAANLLEAIGRDDEVVFAGVETSRCREGQAKDEGNEGKLRTSNVEL